jgi:hypothetical protein
MNPLAIDSAQILVSLKPINADNNGPHVKG